MIKSSTFQFLVENLFSKKQLNCQNSLEIYQISFQLNLVYLKNIVLEYIVANLREFMDANENELL
jgi:hypothetical protein